MVPLGLPDLPGYSDDVLSCLFSGKVAALSMLRSVNDFRLMKLSWTYDINFAPTFGLLRERRYLDGIAAKLPLSPEMRRVLAVLYEYVNSKCAPPD